jgi:hypothetical protein
METALLTFCPDMATSITHCPWPQILACIIPLHPSYLSHLFFSSQALKRHDLRHTHPSGRFWSFRTRTKSPDDHAKLQTHADGRTSPAPEVVIELQPWCNHQYTLQRPDQLRMSPIDSRLDCTSTLCHIVCPSSSSLSSHTFPLSFSSRPNPPPPPPPPLPSKTI